MSPPRQLLARLEAALRRGEIATATAISAEIRASWVSAVDTPRAPEVAAALERSRVLLDRTLRVTLAEGLRPVASEILDAMLQIVGARRGFVGLGSVDGWRLLLGRNLELSDVDNPASQVSTSVIAQALASATPVVAEDALGEMDYRSVLRLELRSVACFPLAHDGRMIGFVYLDDATTPGRFDAAAVAAVQGWLPLVAVAVARTLERGPEPGLPGVVTRNPALLDLLAELARIAHFDASILLTGETGTGKSLIARQIHAASPRAKGPLIHLNCGALPEGLLEAELFGAEAGAYTGAQRRRIGSFEAASGGTLFLDELDAMPLACQVRLLVALQEKQITRLGSNQTVPVDVRVVAAMGRSVDRALAEGRLREDLYFRLAVFVAEIPPLRDRPEDLPVLARRILVRTAERYNLPPLRLSAAAQSELESHTWPGNVRELENTLDRAALLCRDGVIDRLGIRRAPSSAPIRATGLRPALEHAAEALADVMIADPRLRDLDHTRALDGALLRALRTRLGSIEATFIFLDRQRAVEGRNHLKAWRRDVGRLRDLLRQVGEPAPAIDED